METRLRLGEYKKGRSFRLSCGSLWGKIAAVICRPFRRALETRANTGFAACPLRGKARHEAPRRKLHAG